MKILIVEDNEINQRVASKVVTSLGHTVMTAENGLEAVEAAALQPYDAILMDVQMPIMDGLEATRRIRKASGSVGRPRIIAITANAVIGDRDACLGAGMDDYLTKPLRIEPLRAALSKVPCVEMADSNGDLIDHEQFEAIIDPTDPECVEIFEDFCQLGKQQIDELVAASKAADWERVGMIAHQLKGSSSTFGFLRFSEQVAEIEEAAKAPTAPEMIKDARPLQSLFSSSISAVGSL